MTLKVTFKQLSLEDTNSFNQAIKIYVDNFYEDERFSVEEVKDLIKQGKYILFAGISNGTVISMALLFLLPATEYCLVDYFAVSKEERGKGVGSLCAKTMFEFVKKELKKSILLDVEHPLFGGHPVDDVRRIEFYTRLGAKLLDGVNYLLPTTEGKKKCFGVIILGKYLKMLLMMVPKNEQMEIKGEELRYVILEVAKEQWGPIEEVKNILEEVLKSVGQSIKLVDPMQFVKYWRNK